MKTLALALTLLASSAYAAEPCQTFHGTARAYPADGQIRVWQDGQTHQFQPDANSSKQIEDMLGWKGDKQLTADFTVCPTEPFVKGAVQKANIKIEHPQIIPWK